VPTGFSIQEFFMNKVSGAIRASFTSLLKRHLPGRTKRLIFLASFSARLKGSNNFDSATLKKLNEAMALASSDSSIKLPVHLSRAIWDGKTVFDICDENVCSAPFDTAHVRLLAQRVIDAMPSWLRYGEEAVIKEDISKLLDNRDIVLG
jgi:hypothetical protein